MIIAGAEDGVVAVDADGDPAVAIVIGIVENGRTRQVPHELHVAVFVEDILAVAAMIAADTPRTSVARRVTGERVSTSPLVTGRHEPTVLDVAHVVAVVAAHRGH